MAVATLLEAQQTAAGILGYDFAEIQERQRPRVHHLGTMMLDGAEVYAMRTHSGIADKPAGTLRVAKGGTRERNYANLTAAVTDGEELATEMWSKVLARGLGDDYIGGKTILFSDRRLDASQKTLAMRRLQPLMDKAGLADPFVDVTAGDFGIGSQQIDAYALAHREKYGNSSLWQGVITGKSPEYGGLEFRPAATGWGAYISHLVAIQQRHGGSGPAVTKVQGFGNVGAWYAHFASSDPEGRVALDAISDADGTLVSTEGTPIEITAEMVHQIGDRQDVSMKIHRLKDAVEKNQPGIRLAIKPADRPGETPYIISHPADWFVPAALPDVINDKTVKELQVTYGVVEAANGPTTAAAARTLVRQKKLIVPDFIANGGGVDCSIIEHRANLAAHDDPTFKVPSSFVIRNQLAQTSETVTTNALKAAERAGHDNNLRVGAAIISLEAMFSLG